MDSMLEAHMLAERCQMYLRHLRGIVYLLNYEVQCIRPGQLPAEWPKLIAQIQHLAKTTEREITQYHGGMKKSAAAPVSNDWHRAA